MDGSSRERSFLPRMSPQSNPSFLILYVTKCRQCLSLLRVGGVRDSSLCGLLTSALISTPYKRRYPQQEDDAKPAPRSNESLLVPHDQAKHHKTPRQEQGSEAIPTLAYNSIIRNTVIRQTFFSDPIFSFLV